MFSVFSLSLSLSLIQYSTKYNLFKNLCVSIYFTVSERKSGVRNLSRWFCRNPKSYRRRNRNQRNPCLSPNQPKKNQRPNRRDSR